jgi:hypothetical protein
VSKRSSLLRVSTASRVCVWAAVRAAATADHPLRIVTIAVDQRFSRDVFRCFFTCSASFTFGWLQLLDIIIGFSYTELNELHSFALLVISVKLPIGLLYLIGLS